MIDVNSDAECDGFGNRGSDPLVCDETSKAFPFVREANMMVLLAISIFSAGFGVASYAILGTMLPKLDRIAGALAGRSQPFAIIASDLILAERRRAVVRWSAQAPATTPRWREAA
jgi:hypothetical protein